MRLIKESNIQEIPTSARVARWLLALVALGHLAAIVALLSVRDALGEEILAGQASLNADQLMQLTNLELIRTGSFHLLLALVCGIYAVKLQAGRKRVARVVIGSQILSIIFGIVSWFISPAVLHWLTLPFIGIAFLILALLAGPPSSRTFLFGQSSSERGNQPPS